MSLILEIKVIPASGTQRIISDKKGSIKCYLKNPPEKGLANQELIKLLAKMLKLAQDDIEIIAGATARKKIVKIHAPFTQESVLALLGITLQVPLFVKKE